MRKKPRWYVVSVDSGTREGGSSGTVVILRSRFSGKLKEQNFNGRHIDDLIKLIEKE